jgi:hypothetical protein
MERFDVYHPTLSFSPPISVFFFRSNVKLRPPDAALLSAFHFLPVIADRNRHRRGYRSAKEYTEQ